MLRRHIVLLIAIRPSNGDIKPGCPLGAFREEQAMSQHRGSPSPFLSSSHNLHHNYTTLWFRGGQNGVWVGFSRGFSRFPLPQISFHHFSILISSISFHFIRPFDGVSGVVGRHPCYSGTYNMGAASHLIPRPDLVLDTS